MKRYGLVALVSLALVFAACGGGNDGGGGGGGTTTTLDANSAAALAGIFTKESMIPQGPGSMAEENARPPMKAPQAGCDPVWTGDTTDADGDGVYVDASVTMSCDTTIQGVMHLVMQGSIHLTDANDNDPWVGRVTFSGYHMAMEYSYQGYTSSTTHDIDGYIEARHQNNSYTEQADISMNFQTQSPDSSRQVNVSYQGSMTFTPADPTWVPGTTADGTLEMDFTMSFATEATGGTTITGLTVLTPQPLEIRASCNGGAPVSGTLRVTDGASNVLEITWTGCGQYEATFNGNTVTPVM